jgi:hypothetical protein
VRRDEGTDAGGLLELALVDELAHDFVEQALFDALLANLPRTVTGSSSANVTIQKQITNK